MFGGKARIWLGISSACKLETCLCLRYTWNLLGQVLVLNLRLQTLEVGILESIYQAQKLEGPMDCEQFECRTRGNTKTTCMNDIYSTYTLCNVMHYCIYIYIKRIFEGVYGLELSGCLRPNVTVLHKTGAGDVKSCFRAVLCPYHFTYYLAL